MNCNEQVLLFTAGELNEDEKKSFQAHLKTCPKCQAALRFVTQVEENLSAPAAPAALVDKVFAKTTRKRKSSWLWGWKPALTATAMLGMGLLCVSTFRHTDKTTPYSEDFSSYMSENLDEDYQTFSSDLDLFEQYF